MQQNFTTGELVGCANLDLRRTCISSQLARRNIPGCSTGPGFTTREILGRSWLRIPEVHHTKYIRCMYKCKNITNYVYIYIST